jgi:hypothetical protein
MGDVLLCIVASVSQRRQLLLILRNLIPVVALVVVGFGMLGVHSASALAVAQGYSTADSGIKSGMIVAVDGQNQTKVVAATSQDVERVLGIVVEVKDSVVATTSSTSNVYVVTTGQATAYVSDINGAVNKGDVLVVSPMAGILMKADASATTAVGIALQDLDTANLQTMSAKDKDGKQINAKAGRIDITINIGASRAVPETGGWLERVGRSITGKQVSAARVLAAMAIFATLLIIEGSVVYGIVTSSTAAIGRNPMAKKDIQKQSLRNSALAFGILLLASAAIILILWL